MSTINPWNNQVLAANVLFNGGTFQVGTDATANAINIGTAGARTITIGSTADTSTNILAGAGGLLLTGAITSANAITVTAGNIIITSGDLTLTAQTNVGGTTGVIKIANVPFISALDQINNPPSNIFVGANSGNILITMTGTNNTGIGFQSLAALTSGSINTCLGEDSGLSLTTGTANTLIGGASGNSITTASGNVLIGYNPVSSITTGNTNVGVGNNALKGITTGASNIALGNNSGNALTTTDNNNICIGNVGVSGDVGIIRIGTNGTHTSTLIAGTLATQNGITATTGNIQALTGLIIAGGDPGAPISGLTAITNVEDVTVGNSTGVFTIKSKSANSLDSSGFIKIYVRNTAYYIPVFSTPSP